jgi:hypothetical protein
MEIVQHYSFCEWMPRDCKLFSKREKEIPAMAGSCRSTDYQKKGIFHSDKWILMGYFFYGQGSLPKTETVQNARNVMDCRCSPKNILR